MGERFMGGFTGYGGKTKQEKRIAELEAELVIRDDALEAICKSYNKSARNRIAELEKEVERRKGQPRALPHINEASRLRHLLAQAEHRAAEREAGLAECRRALYLACYKATNNQWAAAEDGHDFLRQAREESQCEQS